MTATFESIPQEERTVVNKDKTFGKKIKQAFYITVLFVLFLHSFTVLNNIYYVITQKQFEFVNEETGAPNIKGYVVSSVLVFIIVLFILYK
jgi:hypothetical protein